MEPINCILCFTFVRSDPITCYFVRDSLAPNDTSTRGFRQCIKILPVERRSTLQPLSETKTGIENKRWSKTRLSEIIHVTVLMELDLSKCLWILLDEVSYRQVNVTY